MPQLKQVTSLTTLALDAFLESFVRCCNQLNATGDEGLFLNGVVAIRETVYSRIPGPLLVTLAIRFWENFYSALLHELHYKIALEMIMNVEIVGRRFRIRNPAQQLDSQEGSRFRRLAALDLHHVILHVKEPVYKFLRENHLNDLFIDPKCFTDSDLAIIGRQCQNLEVVKVFNSKYVTNEGLRALTPCSNLRDVHFRRCDKVSHLGFNHMLSVHTKLKDFYYRPADFNFPSSDCGIDESSGLDLSVSVLSLKRLIIESYGNSRPALNLEAVVKKFPNLRYLKINCENTKNLYALKYLDALTELEIKFVSGIRYNNGSQIWEDIEKILTSIGSNMITLALTACHAEFICEQKHLNLIFNSCPNLEHLEFDHSHSILVVPEFEKLKVLTPRSDPPFIKYNLEFCKMPNLETLLLPFFNTNLQTIILMMLDDEKFPNLYVLKTYVDLNAHDVGDIKRIAKESNLDFHVEKINDCSSDDSDTDEDNSSLDYVSFSSRGPSRSHRLSKVNNWKLINCE